MRILSKLEVHQLLFAQGLTIGDWNEIKNVIPGPVASKAHRPPQEGLPLYVFSQALLNWLASGKWILLQIDNSTSPTDDEINIFERLALADEQKWDVAIQKSFLFGEITGEVSASDRVALVLLIFFSLLFEWHVHVTSECSTTGRRLALQDGTVYFFGDNEAFNNADLLINHLTAYPLLLPN